MSASANLPSPAPQAKPLQATPGGSEGDRDLALRRYAPILGYLQYENTVYWTRFHVFLLANSAFLALIANGLPFSTAVVWARLYTLMVAASAGLILSFLWWRVMIAARGWIDRWHAILQELEPLAFVHIQIWRGYDVAEGRFPIKRITQATVGLFVAMWMLVIIYLVVVMVAKESGLVIL